MFKDADKSYGGIWPETTNRSVFTTADFKRAFDSAFLYSIQNINNFSYSNEDRQKSQKSRCLRKEIRLSLVDAIKNRSTKITRKELLEKVNKELRTLYVKPISLGSLKRFIAESNDLTDNERQRLKNILNTRRDYVNSRNHK